MSFDGHMAQGERADRRAMRLLRFILDELCHEGFTLKQIRDSQMTRDGDGPVKRFGRKSLARLVDMDMVGIAGDGYYITIKGERAL